MDQLTEGSELLIYVIAGLIFVIIIIVCCLIYWIKRTNTVQKELAHQYKTTMKDIQVLQDGYNLPTDQNRIMPSRRSNSRHDLNDEDGNHSGAGSPTAVDAEDPNTATISSNHSNGSDKARLKLEHRSSGINQNIAHNEILMLCFIEINRHF